MSLPVLWLKMASNSEQQIEKYLTAFRQFDKNGDGNISKEEFQLVMKNTKSGSKLSQEDINEMVEEADTNNDGTINYQEFVQMLKQ